MYNIHCTCIATSIHIHNLPTQRKMIFLIWKSKLTLSYMYKYMYMHCMAIVLNEYAVYTQYIKHLRQDASFIGYQYSVAKENSSHCQSSERYMKSENECGYTQKIEMLIEVKYSRLPCSSYICLQYVIIVLFHIGN